MFDFSAKGLAAAFLISTTTTAQAIPIKWDVSNVYNEHGGDWANYHWSGYFVYDADISFLYEISVFTEVGRIEHVRPYSKVGTTPRLDSLSLYKPNPGYAFWDHEVVLLFDTALTNAGGRVDIRHNKATGPYSTVYSHEALGYDYSGDYYDYWEDNLGGYIVGTAVDFYEPPLGPIPLPAGLPLALAGLGALALLKRRKAC